MRLIQHLIGIAGFCLVAATASASPSNPQSGVDYRTLDKPQQTDVAASKVEVLEFFWYGCPHCSALEPSLEAWVKKQGDAIVFKRVPVAFRASFVPQQRMYYALEAMGKVEEMQKKIFAAIHGERKALDNDVAITEFMVKNGIDKQKFLDLYNSFSVQAKARRASQLQEMYRIDGVPTLTIGGRYVTTPSIIGEKMGRQPENVLHEATFQVAEHLIAKAAKENAGAPVAATK